MKKSNKQISYRYSVKQKSLTLLLALVLLLSALAGTQLVGNVSAAIDYTEYTGTLDGADWALRIPDPWNGMLVVVCREYSATVPNPVVVLNTYAGSMLDAGFAVAASNYNAVGSSYNEGVDSSYQLTMHIIDNYDVKGKIFLLGTGGLGGAIALLLGEKYPDVYSGVLDLGGIKDAVYFYNKNSKWSTMTDEELEAELTAIGSPIPPIFFSSLDAYREFLALAATNDIAALGGTPKTHLEAYEAVSPVCHADIQIPVMTIHGTANSLILYYHCLLYQEAVAKAGSAYLYRLYTVLGGGYSTSNVTDEVPARFNELVEWSNELTGSSDWPMFGHDPSCSRYSTSNAPNTNQILWPYEMGSGTQSSPVVADGKVYIGSNNKNIYCLDAASGALIWNYTTGATVGASPAVADGKVYVGSRDNNVYCLDAATGALIWSYTTSGWASTPTVANGKVYVGANDGAFYCLRADWGQVEWKFSAGDGVVGSPSVVNGKVYFGSWNGKVYCLNAATSVLIWSYTTGDEVWASPVVADGKVYVGAYDDKVYCLNAASGALIWSYTTSGSIRNSPAVAYGKVYVGSYDDNVYCLDANTGALIWNYTTSGDVWDSPAVAYGKVYVGSFDKNVYCLDAATGTLIWSYTTGDAVWSSPAVANGVVYIGTGTADARVLAFSPWAPIPESLTIEVMLILSTIAIIVSIRYFRKRPKWQHW